MPKPGSETSHNGSREFREITAIERYVEIWWFDLHDAQHQANYKIAGFLEFETDNLTAIIYLINCFICDFSDITSRIHY